MSTDGHGIPDNAAKGAHELLHQAEQEQHEHDASSQRGPTDEAVRSEHDSGGGVEGTSSVSPWQTKLT